MTRSVDDRSALLLLGASLASVVVSGIGVWLLLYEINYRQVHPRASLFGVLVAVAAALIVAGLGALAMASAVRRAVSQPD